QTDWKPDEHTAWQLVAQAAVIVGAVLLVYLPACRAGFIWDDEQLITANPLLRTFSGLIEIWSGGQTADLFSNHQHGVLDRAPFVRRPARLSRAQYFASSGRCGAGLAGFASLANSGRVVRRTDFRHSSRARGIGGLDFRAKKRPRDVFYVVVDLFFCWKQRAAAKSCGVS